MASKEIRVRGTRITHPDRVLFPPTERPAVTKGDLAGYYAEVAPRLLPGLRGRIVSLLRAPAGIDGERFFQKHAGPGFPDAIVEVETGERGHSDPRMLIPDIAALLAAVQFGTIEFHAESGRQDRPDRPDRVIFDLDPDEGLGFAAVRGAAEDLRRFLAGIGLPGWALLSGGKGIHVIVPLRRTVRRDRVKDFAEAVAQTLARRAPGRFTATSAKAKREGKVFIDWLRNSEGATAVVPFSVRARPGAPVAVPVGWDELAGLERADHFGLDAARARGWDDLDLPRPVDLGPALKTLAGLGSEG